MTNGLGEMRGAEWPGVECVGRKFGKNLKQNSSAHFE